MNRIILLFGLTLASGCARRPSVAPMPAPPPPASAAERYAALPDTAVCVVDRTTRRGLRSLAGKVEADGQVVVLVAGRIQKLETLHPVGVPAGYAARESWVVAGEPINVQDRRYEKVGPERLIGMEQVQRTAEYRAIPLFTDPNDASPPKALYLPLRPGCVFQAYVRSDLLR
jgi:hypothetical protein